MLLAIIFLLERRGRNYLHYALFIMIDHPSMSVSPEKQIFMCFVCSHGGNVFTFLQEYLKISYYGSGKDGCSNGKC